MKQHRPGIYDGFPVHHRLRLRGLQADNSHYHPACSNQSPIHGHPTHHG